MLKQTAIAATIALTLPTFASTEEFRQHDAHVHGQVEFNIAQDANSLLVEITAPGADVVGFEHAPENHQQEKLIAQAVKTLSNPSQLLAINSRAKCKLVDTDVSHSLEGEHDEHHDHDHDDDHHDEHGHKDKHDKHHDHDDDHHDKHAHKDKHDKHHDHDDEHDEHDEHDEEGSGHGEFSAQYEYECGNLDALSQISTKWFTHFERTEAIQVNLLTDVAQTATKLDAKNTTIRLK